jgi:acylphosphatase
MKLKNRIASIQLEKGQVWKLEDTHIEIVAMGKSLTHYRRLTHLKQKGVPVKLERIQTVENYLKTHGATLVKNSASN